MTPNHTCSICDSSTCFSPYVPCVVRMRHGLCPAARRYLAFPNPSGGIRDGKPLIIYQTGGIRCYLDRRILIGLPESPSAVTVHTGGGSIHIGRWPTFEKTRRPFGPEYWPGAVQDWSWDMVRLEPRQLAKPCTDLTWARCCRPEGNTICQQISG